MALACLHPLRRVKEPRQLTLGGCCGGCISLFVGFIVGGRSRDTLAEESLHSLEFAYASQHFAQTMNLLTALRDGPVEPARDRLEAHLDSAIVDLGHHCTASRDADGTAIGVLRKARAYRLAHPEQFSGPMRQDVDTALTKLPPTAGRSAFSLYALPPYRLTDDSAR